MQERFIYDSSEIQARNLAFVPPVAIFLFAAAYYYFSRPSRDEMLYPVLGMVAVMIVLVTGFIFLMSRKLGKEQVVIDENGITHLAGGGENCISWEDISEIELRQTGSASKGVIYVRAPDRSAIKIYPYIKHEHDKEQDFEALYKILRNRTRG